MQQRLAFCAAFFAACLPAPAAAQAEDWQKLDLKSFGQELTAPWVPVPNGSSGAPRQGWLATADGFFTREIHLAYDYTRSDAPDRHQALARFHYPVSRRLWLGVEAPFYQNSAGRGDFGDVTVTTQLMLAESRNLSVNAGVGWRLPTGATRAGNNRFIPTPQLNLWSDVGSGFSVRGRIGREIADRGQGDGLVMNAAIGQTVTPHDATPFGDLTWYVAGNWREPISGGGPAVASVTPGMRTHLTGNLFLLAGVEFAVANRAETFRERYIVQLVQGF